MTGMKMMSGIGPVYHTSDFTILTTTNNMSITHLNSLSQLDGILSKDKEKLSVSLSNTLTFRPAQNQIITGHRLPRNVVSQLRLASNLSFPPLMNGPAERLGVDPAMPLRQHMMPSPNSSPPSTSSNAMSTPPAR